MWRIMIAMGILLCIVGVIADGRNPVVAVQESVKIAMATSTPYRSPTPTSSKTATVTLTPSHTSTPLPTNTATPSNTPLPTETPLPKKLFFYRKSLDDDPHCMSVQIRGIKTRGWTFKVNGTDMKAKFDPVGNARICGLPRAQDFVFTVFNTRGGAVVGGIDVYSKGGAIMIADWK